MPVSTLAGKGTRYFSGRVSKKKKNHIEIFFWAQQAVDFEFPVVHCSLSMALPQKIQRQFSPEEIQFIAGNEFISIIPNFTLDKMEFIQVQLLYFSWTRRA